MAFPEGHAGDTGSSGPRAWVRGLHAATARFRPLALALLPRPHLLFQEAPVFEQLPVVRQCALFGFHCHLARGHKNTKP